MSRVLVCGVYLASREHLAGAIVAELGRSTRHRVEQRWVALDEDGAGLCDLPHTVLRVTERTDKFDLVNAVSKDAAEFDVVIVTDDDILLPSGFLDDFLHLVERFDFALAQPARTLSSDLSHPITQQALGLLARQTRFVEIGPLFVVRRDAIPLLIPFDIRSAMGWGLDFVWPAIIAGAGLRMGMIDATPVEHGFRPAVSHYQRADAMVAQRGFLASTPHLGQSEAFTVLDAYPA